ncbi:AAA family ATPase [Ensifer sp. ENS11]|uniref:AAA family ATPase n=1 Tax=Ensifer sp. ENS11 TaxID=2769291 RepID=UPI0017862C5F|nr:AAA family ATPase [Ensifer sp. ENS11]MBD9490448.1 AAA family ATPase [Ensifer sp. ENS11]MDP9632970.1 shikimate kinase [Ensifer adhaerens]
MIIVLNGYPGVGKLTIGQELISRISGRLLDIHSVYNVAFALTVFKSPEFIDTVEKIEAIAHDLIRKLPAEIPVVLTTVLAGSSDWGDAEWKRIVCLGRERAPLLVVHLHCDLDENIRRIEAAERATKRKPRDAEMARRNHAQGKVLAGIDEANLLELDVTDLSPTDAAAKIAEWIQRFRV